MTVTVFHLVESTSDRAVSLKANRFPDGLVEVTNAAGLRYCWVILGAVEISLAISASELDRYAIDGVSFGRDREVRLGLDDRLALIIRHECRAWRVPSSVINGGACRLLTNRELVRHASGASVFPTDVLSDKDAMRTLDVVIEQLSVPETSIDAESRLLRLQEATTSAVRVLCYCVTNKIDKKMPDEFRGKIDRLKELMSAPNHMAPFAAEYEEMLARYLVEVDTHRDRLLAGNDRARALRALYTSIDSIENARNVITSIVETIEKVRAKGGKEAKKGKGTDHLTRFIIQTFQSDPQTKDAELQKRCLDAEFKVKPITIRRRCRDNRRLIEEQVRPMSPGWTIIGYLKSIPRGRKPAK